MFQFKNRFDGIPTDESLSDREKTYLQSKMLIDLENITEDSVVIDIGCNHGEVVRALVDTGCKIYAFEPHPVFYGMLNSKFSRESNVFLSNEAVWRNKEKRKFYFKKSRTAINGGATLMEEKENIIDHSLNIEVDCLDIAELIGRFDSVDILKIDVEGAEYELLDRLYESGLHERVKSIYFEDHERKMISSRFMQLKYKVVKDYSSAERELYWW